MTDEVKTPVVAEVKKTTVPEFNIEDLHKEIDAANKKIVSEDVSKLLEQERAKAKAEAEKEFHINQKLKEKEAELEALKKAQLEREKEAATQLEMLRRKVDELASSKQPISIQNPFNTSQSQKDDKPSILKMKEEELEAVERASFEALLDRKIRT